MTHGSAQRQVLVVESNALVQGLLTDLFADAGFEVLHAATAIEALSLAQTSTLSLMIVEPVLVADRPNPGLVSALRAVSASRHVPIVVLSGRTRDLDGRAHEADLIFTKPFDIDELMNGINGLIEQENLPRAAPVFCC